MIIRVELRGGDVHLFERHLERRRQRQPEAARELHAAVLPAAAAGGVERHRDLPGLRAGAREVLNITYI